MSLLSSSGGLLLSSAGNLETIGLRGQPYSNLDIDSDPGCFIHGRDYAMKMPESYTGDWTPESSSYIRVYRLFPDHQGNTYSGPSTYVSKPRELLFTQAICGYPWMDKDSNGNPILRRNAPEPLRYRQQTSFTWLDNRGSTSTTQTRYYHFASRVLKIEGVGELANPPETRSALWPNTQQSQPAEECYKELRIHVLFERQNREIMIAYPDQSINDPLYNKADPYFGGEWSRCTLYQDDPQGRIIQTQGSVNWITTPGYDQPTGDNLVSGATFASKEGKPLLLGENMILWKWEDVPLAAYNWYGIQSWFGRVNSTDFPYPTGIVPGSQAPPATTTSPFVSYAPQTLLLRTASRKQKTSNIGLPLWDIIFYFQHTPWDDGFGLWNRLVNNKGYAQRYMLGGGTGNFYPVAPFASLFLPKGATGAAW